MLEHDAQHSSSSSEEEEELYLQSEEETTPPTPSKDKRPSASKKPKATQMAQTSQLSFSDESGSDSDSDPNNEPISSKPMEDTTKAAKKPKSKPSASALGTAKRPSENRTQQKSKKSKMTGDDKQTSQSSSSDDSGSESDSDPNIEPISWKPMEATPKATKKPKSNPSASVLGTFKRALKKKSGQDSKKAKKTGNDKKQLFQRLWSEKDEIDVLKGLIQYKAKIGAEPLADMNAFYDYIREKLLIDVSKAQLSSKVRRLKKKFETKKKKGGKMNITKPHEQSVYNLSKRLLGGDSKVVG